MLNDQFRKVGKQNLVVGKKISNNEKNIYVDQC